MKSFTKTKLLIFFFILISIFTFVYFYVYKSHREISSEDAAFNVIATELLEEFQTDEATATTKYANLTIEIYGEITKLDLENNIILINDGISVQMVAFDKQLNVSESIHVKGRLVGYDDLMEEIIIDQAIITDNEK
jgi:hypothetical protein